MNHEAYCFVHKFQAMRINIITSELWWTAFCDKQLCNRFYDMHSLLIVWAIRGYCLRKMVT